MKKIIALILILIVIIACDKDHQKERTEKKYLVEILKTNRVLITPNDTISPPAIVKAGRPKIEPAKSPIVVDANLNEYELKKEIPVLEINFSELNYNTPGTGGFKPAEGIYVKPKVVQAVLPEIILAKDMDSKDNNPGSFSYFNSIHGLPSSVIRDLLEDKFGNLWISTTGGVCRYDGKYFSNYTQAQGLAHNDITAMLQSRNGNLWFAGYQGSVTSFDGKYFTQYQFNYNLIKCIYEDLAGNIWLGSKGGGVWLFNGKQFKHFGKEQGFGSDDINFITDSRDGKIWFGTMDGIFIYNGKSFSKIPIKGSCNAIAKDNNGNMYFGIDNHLYKFDGKTLFQYHAKDSIAEAPIIRMSFDRSGNLWLGTTLGIEKFDGSSFILFNEKSGLPGLRIEDIIQDKAGNIWIGYDQGVCRYDGNLFTHFTRSEGLPDANIFSLFRDSKDRLWMSSLDYDGVVCYDGKRFFIYTTLQGLPGRGCYSITEDKDGTIWFAFWGSGLCAYDGKTFTTYSEEEGLLTNSIFTIAADKQGNIWCGTNKGLSKFESDRTRFTHYTKENGICDDVRSIVAGKENDVWVGSTCEGLYHLSNNKITKYIRTPEVGIDGGQESLFRDHNQYIWSGSYENGLYCFDGKKSIHFTPQVLGVNNTFTTITEDNNGNLWFGTFASGLVKLDYKKFEEWKKKIDSSPSAANTFQPIDYQNIFYRYGHEDGFYSTTVWQRAAAKDKKGNIWFGTPDRLTKVSVTNEQADNVSSDVNLLSVKLFNEEINWNELKAGSQKNLGNGIALGKILFDSTSSYYNLPVNLSLPYENNNITFEFIAVNLKSGRKMVYQYMLRGLDKDWSSPTSKTEVNFGNLSQGDYTFRVKAMNRNGYWGPVYEYSFVVRPPRWLTWWFLLLAGLFSIGTAVVYIKRREMILKERQRVLEITVEERTTELVAEKKEVEKQKAVLEKEKKRSDELLLNILPEEVAEELKNTGVATARNFSNVTILFTDFIGFTAISEKLDADELVNELNICFSKFDEIVTSYDIEKIKTIGDSYMCAGGLSGQKIHSAVNVVSAGLEMQSFIVNRRSERIAMGKPGFQMRLGIHTGPVISGVVGFKKFQYDIWGDSVNTAKRLESAGESGRVNISASTYELVKEKFKCENRTNIIIKGKGEIAMYFVNHRI